MSTHVHRSIDRRAALTKAAAVDPAKAAFAAGFSRGAEALGVDPGTLCKQAAPALSEELIQRLDPHYLARGTAAYLKAVDPANIGAAAGIAGGAGLLGAAVLPGKGKSKIRRIASGVAGAGLLGGGAYLASNENARNAVRKAVLGTLGRAVEPFRTKMAEDRSMARRAFMKAAADHSFGNLASEVIGHTGGNAAVLGTLGLAAGPVGSLAGVAAGSLGTPLGGLLALIKRRRTAAEQVAYDSSSHILKNLLVPGAGSYNMWKRIGRIVGSHMEKKSADAAYAAGFCKAAEAAGVDPVALYKQAIAVGDAVSLGLKAWRGLRGAGSAAARAARNPRQTLATARGMGSRYLELLRGGNAERMAPVRQVTNNMAEWGGDSRIARGLLREGARGRFAFTGRKALQQVVAGGGLTQAEADSLGTSIGELRKVMGARLGAGALGTAGVVGGAKALSGSSATANQGTPGAAAQDVGHNLTGIGQ